MSTSDQVAAVHSNRSLPIQPPHGDEARATLQEAEYDRKLKGIGYNHFAGFFYAKYRENDYLWGRLDGVELILRLLLEVGETHASSKAVIGLADKYIPHLTAGLTAVLDAETT